MDFDRDKLWVTICLGIVTISSAAVGVAFFSAGLADLTITEIDGTSLAWLVWKFAGVLMVVAVYWHMLRRAEIAMFVTDFDLAKMGTNRREAVRHIFNGLFFVLFGLLLIVALNTIQDLSASLNPVTAMPAVAD